MIGVISDTHGDLISWEKVMREIFADVELILHCGDVLYHGPRNPLPPGYNPSKLAEAINNLEVPIIIAKGNCDAEVDQLVLDLPLLSPYAFLYWKNLKVLVNHGHLISAEERLRLAKRYSLDIFISGHTHQSEIKKEEGIIFLNPGSPSLPLGKAVATVATITEKEIKIVEVERRKTQAKMSIK